jgi:hypothetical protein
VGRIGNRFRRDVRAFAAAHGIPVLRLKKPDRTRWDDRRLDHVRPYLERAEREVRFGVVAIIACQEFQRVLSARNRAKNPGAVSFEFFTADRRVGVYYFVLRRRVRPRLHQDLHLLPLHGEGVAQGHQWARHRAERAVIAFTALSNGFQSCPESAPVAGAL